MALLFLLFLTSSIFAQESFFFDNIQFIETRETFLKRRNTIKPDGDLVEVELQFKGNNLTILGKESTYYAITTIPLSDITGLVYDYVEKNDYVNAKATTAILINPAFIIASTKDRQHWFQIQHTNKDGEKIESKFLLSDENEMAVKWLTQAKTSLLLTHLRNGKRPPNSLRPGMTAFDVIDQIGDPLRVMHFGNKTIFFYEKHIVGLEIYLWFENGILEDIR